MWGDRKLARFYEALGRKMSKVK
ncbi:MAG: hypothetical protein RIR25_1553, partial [Verrucomicrobiota bacterium]